MEKNQGHVIALSSIAGMMGLPNLVPYCTSKFAVRGTYQGNILQLKYKLIFILIKWVWLSCLGLMEALAEELRQEGRNIGFTTVFPYMTDTGLCKSPRIK